MHNVKIYIWYEYVSNENKHKFTLFEFWRVDFVYLFLARNVILWVGVLGCFETGFSALLDDGVSNESASDASGGVSASATILAGLPNLGLSAASILSAKLAGFALFHEWSSKRSEPFL